MKKQIYKIITQPTKCPACNADLVKVKDQLFCRNESCEAQSSKKLEHYAKVLKIKGLGPKSIEKLGITTIIDLYDLTESTLVDVLGKNGVKIYSNSPSQQDCRPSIITARFLYKFSRVYSR